MTFIDKHILYINNTYSFKNYVMLSKKEIHEIWKWRNDDRIRKCMFHTDIITLENHLNFIYSLKKRTDCYYWMVSKGDIPIGVFYMQNIKGEIGDFGYYCKPGIKGVGFGLVKEGLYFVLHTLGFKAIQLSVLNENIVAIALDIFLGFKFNRTENLNINDLMRTFLFCDEYKLEDIIKRYNKSDESYYSFMRKLERINYFDLKLVDIEICKKIVNIITK